MVQASASMEAAVKVRSMDCPSLVSRVDGKMGAIGRPFASILWQVQCAPIRPKAHFTVMV